MRSLALALMFACSSKSTPPAPAVEAAEPTEPAAVEEEAEEEVVQGISDIDRLPEDHEHGGQAREASSIDMVVIHTVGGQYCADGELARSPAGKDAVYWRDWFETQGGKSIHYIVGREG
ncbi:MAG: hypothetical protein AAF211_27620, partial [Myxococcota bacterium]